VNVCPTRRGGKRKGTTKGNGKRNRIKQKKNQAQEYERGKMENGKWKEPWRA
jgi:hypothetical protein